MNLVLHFRMGNKLLGNYGLEIKKSFVLQYLALCVDMTHLAINSTILCEIRITQMVTISTL